MDWKYLEYMPVEAIVQEHSGLRRFSKKRKIL
jgi:hypothetical protein